MSNFHKVACICLLLILGASVQAVEKPDEYGDVCWEREKEILRNFAIELKNRPESKGHLIHYAGRRTPSLEAALRRGRRAKEYLVKLGVSPDRVVTVDGGFREEFTWEVWVVPPGASPPAATPTVGRGEVRIVANPRTKPCQRQHVVKSGRT